MRFIGMDLVGIIVIACVVSLFILFVDRSCSKPYPIGVATVLSKNHVPASTASGYAISEKGDLALVTTSSAEEWLVIVKRDGNAMSLPVSSATWAEFEVGNTVQLCRYRGLLADYEIRIVGD